jgi:hypothetical protein
MREGTNHSATPHPIRSVQEWIAFERLSGHHQAQTAEGEFKHALLGDNPEEEEYVKHYTFFLHHKERRELRRIWTRLKIWS